MDEDLSALAYQVWVLAKPAVLLAAWLVVLLAIFVPLEHYFTLRPAKIKRKQFGVDVAWYFINSLVIQCLKPAAIIALPLAAVSQLLHGTNPAGYYSMVAAWPIWIKLPLAFLVNDFGSYWYHRASHKIGFLWQFHAVHHSAEHIDWLVNTRAHPIDMVFTRLSGLAPVFLLGLAQPTSHGIDSMVPLIIILGTLWAFFIHANVKLRLGPLEWLISTPAFHHWHHTNDEHRDRNFAAIFPIFDWLFGTAWLPREWPPVYGIDAKVAPTLAGQFLDPLPGQRPAAAADSQKAKP